MAPSGDDSRVSVSLGAARKAMSAGDAAFGAWDMQAAGDWYGRAASFLSSAGGLRLDAKATRELRKVQASLASAQDLLASAGDGQARSAAGGGKRWSFVGEDGSQTPASGGRGGPSTAGLAAMETDGVGGKAGAARAAREGRREAPL